jgi:protein kinase D
MPLNCFGPLKKWHLKMILIKFYSQKAIQMVEKQLQIEAASTNGHGHHPSSQNGPPSILVGEIQLFLHDYKSFNILTCLNSLAQLVGPKSIQIQFPLLKDNGSVVEIIRIDRHEKPTRPHSLLVNTYVTPTFCDYCGEILMGLVKQGLQCQLCKFENEQIPHFWHKIFRCNFHKKCAFAPRNNCAKWEAVPTTFLAGAGQFPIEGANGIEGDPKMEICSIHIKFKGNDPNQQNAQQIHPKFQLPHSLLVHNYKMPTVCKICDKLLVGIVKQGLRCRDCKVPKKN